MLEIYESMYSRKFLRETIIDDLCLTENKWVLNIKNDKSNAFVCVGVV